MAGRKHAALQRRVARVLSSWKDPHHDRPYPELEIVQQVDIAEDGEINLTLKPARPHCPCCLLDLDALRKRLCEIKVTKRNKPRGKTNREVSAHIDEFACKQFDEECQVGHDISVCWNVRKGKKSSQRGVNQVFVSSPDAM